MGTITHEDIAQALQDALNAAQSSGDTTIDYSYGLSMSEIAEALGIGMSATRRRMRIAKDNGIVECTGRQMRKNIADEWNPVPVYRVVKKTE